MVMRDRRPRTGNREQWLLITRGEGPSRWTVLNGFDVWVGAAKLGTDRL